MKTIKYLTLVISLLISSFLLFFGLWIISIAIMLTWYVLAIAIPTTIDNRATAKYNEMQSQEDYVSSRLDEIERDMWNAEKAKHKP